MNCYGIIAILLCVTAEINSSCIHDEIQALDVASTNLMYGEENHLHNEVTGRLKRSRRSQQYKPIRIKFFKLDFDFHLTKEESARVDQALKSAINFVEETLSVIPLTSPLILKRSGCQKTWFDEPHIGKCAVLSKNFKEERCNNLLKIPDSHLEGLWLWKKNHETEEGQEVFPPGEGLTDTDIVLYITAKTTDTCYRKKHSEVLAYAGYCQLDQYSRPVASFINFCPYLVRSTNISQQEVYLSVLHELFHALGFTKTLFDKVRDCSRAVFGVCPQRSTRVVQLIKGVNRFVAPSVVRHAQQHFGCLSEERFGGPLHVENGILSSHWSQTLMFGSIMAPKLGLAHQTVIDPLTLAFFEDTGWYKVNYTKAENFFWGKDAGCDFGSVNSCKKDYFFCNTEESTMCHYLHRDKGHCRMRDSQRTCGVVESTDKDRCSFSKNDKQTNTLEVFSDRSLCFLSNLTRTEDVITNFEGICLQCRRVVNHTLEVRVQMSDWVDCPYGELITIPGYYGFIQCPKFQDVVCPVVEKFQDTTTPDDISTLAAVTSSVIHQTSPSTVTTQTIKTVIHQTSPSTVTTQTIKTESSSSPSHSGAFSWTLKFYTDASFIWTFIIVFSCFLIPL